jgi:hypothetical protein
MTTVFLWGSLLESIFLKTVKKGGEDSRKVGYEDIYWIGMSEGWSHWGVLLLAMLNHNFLFPELIGTYINRV